MNATERRRHAHRLAYLVIQQALDGGVTHEEIGMRDATVDDAVAIEKHLDKLAQYHFNHWKGPQE